VEPNTIKINEVEYVRKDQFNAMAKEFEGMKYVICRTYSAGVFAGYLENRKDKEVVMRKARRIWHWSGAATLSQLAIDGTSKPNDCKFPAAVNRITLLEAIEIIDCTEKAQTSIEGVKEWKQ